MTKQEPFGNLVGMAFKLLPVIVVLSLQATLVSAQMAWSTADLWDVAKGATITASSPLQEADATGMFGGPGGREILSTIFSDSPPDGSTHFVEWKTPGVVRVTSFNLFAVGDGPGYNNEREFAQFVLKAKKLATDDFQTIYTYTPTHPYSFIDPVSYGIISASIPAVDAQFFRAEFVQFDGHRGFDGPRIIELDAFGDDNPPTPPPTIVKGPESRTVNVGDEVIFAVEATGTGTLSYQWAYYGFPIANANASTYRIPSAQMSHAGDYVVRVTDLGGTTLSVPAVLSVQTQPLENGQSTTDLFDVRQGSQVIATSGIRSGFHADSMFGGEQPSWEEGTTIFQDDLPNGTVHSIEWKTSTAIELRSFRLFASGDGAEYMHEREFARFTLKAKSSAAAADYDITVYDFVPAQHPYTFSNTAPLLVLDITNTPVTARFFKAEFVQWNAGRDYDGPRVIELDGFGERVGNPDPLIADWTFEEGFPGTLVQGVKDHSGNGNDGTIFGKPEYTLTDQADGYISLVLTANTNGTAGAGFQSQQSVDFNLGTEFTIEASVEPGAGDADWDRGIVAGHDAASGRLAYLFGYKAQGRVVSFTVIDAQSEAARVSAALPDDNRPHHLAAVLKGGELAIYLDHALVEKIATTKTPGIQSGGLGQVTVGHAAGLYPFDGTLDRIRISRQGLAPAQFFPKEPDANAGLVLVKPLADQTALAGTSLKLEVFALAPAAITYEWSLNGSVLDGENSSALTLANVDLADAGSYSVKLSSGGQTLTSSATVVVTEDRRGPEIFSQPTSRSIIAGQPVTFNVGAASPTPLSYQWNLNGAPIEGATDSTLSIDPVQFSHAGSYTVTVRNAGGSVTSRAAVLTVLDPGVVGTVVMNNRLPGRDVPITDAFGTRLAGTAYLVQLYTGASDETLVPTGPAIHFRTGAAAGFFQGPIVEIPGTTPGQVLRGQLRAWETVAGGSYAAAVTSGGQYGHSAAFALETGGGILPPRYMMELQPFSLSAKPRITQQPASLSAYIGENVTLQVGAAGTGPLAFRWKHNDEVIEDAASATLTIENVLPENAGSYTVEISNSFGSVTSQPATLTVKQPDPEPPVITLEPVTPITTAQLFLITGRVTDNVGLHSFTWRKNNQPVGAVIVNHSGEFTLDGVTLSRGANVIELHALDEAGNLATRELTVTLVASRTISLPDIAAVQEGGRVTFPIQVESKGDIGALTFEVIYDPNSLSEPELAWSAEHAGAFNQVNLNTPGTIRASLALPGLTLPEGTNNIAQVSFRARSVPENVESAIGLNVLGVYSALGNPITSGTDVRASKVSITRREYVGDNNANDRIDVGDATIIMRLVTLLDPVRQWDVTGNDLNGNSDLDAGDITKVLRMVVGLDPQPGTPAPQPPPALPEGSYYSYDEMWTPPVGVFPPLTINPNSKVTVDKTRLVPGDTLTVTVSLLGLNNTQIDPSISGASFRLDYPTEALKLESAASHRAGALVPAGAVALWNVSPAQNNYATQDGSVRAAFTSATSWEYVDGDLAVFTFRVQPGAASRYLWNVNVSQVEASDGFSIFPFVDATANVTGRDPIPAGLEADAAIENGTFAFTIDGELGVRYRIEASEDLRTWTDSGTQVNTTGTLQIRDPAAGINPHRFYRAIQLD